MPLKFFFCNERITLPFEYLIFKKYHFALIMTVLQCTNKISHTKCQSLRKEKPQLQYAFFFLFVYLDPQMCRFLNALK